MLLEEGGERESGGGREGRREEGERGGRERESVGGSEGQREEGERGERGGVKETWEGRVGE